MLHVLGFVHADSQFDLQVMVRTGLGQGHLMQLGLLGAVRGWVKNNLYTSQTCGRQN